ncbi:MULTISPECIES: hypothetical protein [Micromonospora]|uniref:ESX-1 secretion-associated protein EspA/EspE-like domain-containing protein n=1 Tax=Micromonospora profundi TaxID=1420889 RepID=A0AAJ6L1H3_9ACTN|nr:MULTISPECIES: hypothetical protein [Micromonospora]KOX08629.1 hypothetical protein ADK66_15200 [Micromonospora sp. NRRL B-16802]NJC11942.1 uncharacterized protein YukE [Micromonospora profundi]WLS43826.1 hypothetical protein Q3V37_20750 [Micromonospora profundi]
MSFTLAQYEATMDKLSSKMTDLSDKLDKVDPTVRRAVDRWFITQGIADRLIWVGNKLLELGSAILDKIAELLKGAAAPVTFFFTASEWQGVRGLATDVSGELKPEQLGVARVWHGQAADAYIKQIKPQSDAAARIGVIADKTATALNTCAVAGLAFYVALAVILTKFIIATIAALAALGSVVFSWAGAALIVEEAAVNTGMIIAAVSTLTAVLGAQASQMVALHGEAIDASAFPGGNWPDAAPGHFSDATVTDGDADWSLQS